MRDVTVQTKKQPTTRLSEKDTRTPFFSSLVRLLTTFASQLFGSCQPSYHGLITEHPPSAARMGISELTLNVQPGRGRQMLYCFLTQGGAHEYGQAHKMHTTPQQKSYGNDTSETEETTRAQNQHTAASDSPSLSRYPVTQPSPA